MRQSQIATISGKVLDLFNPRPEDIDIEDVAHALSYQVRFCGHISHFVSVAQHCVLVSRMCETFEGQRWGLLHDAAEAYISDVPKPLKKHLPLFQEIEERVLRAIGEHFGLSWPMPEEVKVNDYVSLYHEASVFMPHGPPMPRPTRGQVPTATLTPWSFGAARVIFLDEVYRLELR